MKYLLMFGVLLLSTLAASAEYVNGYFRQDGTYVNGYYRNSYSSSTPSYNNNSQRNSYVNPLANPSRVNVRGYYRSNGTYVRPHQRTAPNSYKWDNLNY